MHLIEYHPCNSKTELIARESIMAKLHKASLNTQKQSRTPKQYRIDNKEYIYRKETCNCGIEYVITHRARHLKSERHTTRLNNLLQYCILI